MNATFLVTAGGQLQEVSPKDPRRPESVESVEEEKNASEDSQAIQTSKIKPKRRRPRNPVTVDTSKAKSNLKILRICLEELGWGWKELHSSGGKRIDSDIQWLCVSDPSCFSGINTSSIKVNKYPGMQDISNKACLTRIINKMQLLFPKSYSFYPSTWILPDEFHIFSAMIYSLNKNTRPSGFRKPFFIVKPDAGTQGDGIYLVRDPEDITSMGMIKSAVVQEYISKPFLLEQKKFDLRIYVVLTDIDPPKFYLYKEGMARFCTLKYHEPTWKNHHKAYMHLTNYSLNKHSEHYVYTDNVSKGSKRTMSSVFLLLEERGYDTNKLWSAIEDVVCKAILAMIPALKIYYHSEICDGKSLPKYFQILGLDILITEDSKSQKILVPKLLEINSNPSLSLDFEHEVSPGVSEYLPSAVDEEIKIPLIKDTLMLLRPIKKKERKESASQTEDEQDYDQNDTPEDSKTGESSLIELYPAKYKERYENFRLIERIANIFIHFLGVRGSIKMGATAFRTYSRRCGLCSGGISMASIDILYIDVARRWNEMTGISSGLCFNAFVEAFFILANRKFFNKDLSSRVNSLLELSEKNLNSSFTWTSPQAKLRMQRLHRIHQYTRNLYSDA